MPVKTMMIPFSPSGNLVEWDGASTVWDGTQMVRVIRTPNYVFESELKLVGYQKGRSSMKFTFEDQDGKQYGMFLKDFLEVVPDLVNARVSGHWTFVKRGANYGIVRA